MSFDAHKNFAYSTVATAPSPATSGTSLVVAAGDGTKFPAVPFNAVICPLNAAPTTTNAEIVRVTNIATDTLTITRTQESTSARTVIVGDQIFAGVTTKLLTDIEAAIPSRAGTILGRTFFAPTTPTGWSVTAASLTIVDATNLSLTFTTAASGAGSTEVIVELQCGAQGANILQWGLSGTGGPSNSYQVFNNSNNVLLRTMKILVTGLTANTTYTWNWSALTNTGTQSMYAGSSASGALSSALPAIMVAYAGTA